MLGRKAIKLFMRLGWIRCVPDPVCIGENGIDVTLGDTFCVLDTERVAEVRPDGDASEQFLCERHDVLRVRPGCQVIGATHEFIGSTVSFIVPELRTRSTLAGWGVDLGGNALMGEAGFASRWRLAIRNHQSATVRLFPGWRVGQVVFHLCFGGERYDRSYNVAVDEWDLVSLLPKAMA